jgi:hypothetical protein
VCVCVYAFRPILLSLPLTIYTRRIRWLSFFSSCIKFLSEDATKEQKKTNAARFESPLGSNRSKRTHFHFQSRLFFVFFLSFFQLVCHFLPESVKQFNTKIKINFVITLNLQPPTLRTDSSAFSVSWKRVINKGKVEGQNFPTHTHTHPKKREREMVGSIGILFTFPSNHKKRKGPHQPRPYKQFLWDLSPLVVISSHLGTYNFLG